jgi:hypothetical protein
VDLIKNWDVHGVPGAGGGHPLQRLATYLAAHLDVDDSADADSALAVLDAVRRIRTGQQHAHHAHEAIDGASGVPRSRLSSHAVVARTSSVPLR